MIQLICQSFTSWISLGSHLVSIIFERYNNGMSPTNLRSSRYSLSSYYVNFTRHLKVNFDYFPYLQGIKITTAVSKIGEQTAQFRWYATVLEHFTFSSVLWAGSSMLASSYNIPWNTRLFLHDFSISQMRSCNFNQSENASC